MLVRIVCGLSMIVEYVWKLCVATGLPTAWIQ